MLNNENTRDASLVLPSIYIARVQRDLHGVFLVWLQSLNFNETIVLVIVSSFRPTGVLLTVIGASAGAEGTPYIRQFEKCFERAHRRPSRLTMYLTHSRNGSPWPFLVTLGT